MKPYEEVCFPSGIIRWTRENNLYVCRLTEDQINEIKEIHEKPWVGLTKEDLETIHQELFNMSGWSFNTMAKAVEAKLKEKNHG